ncbi:hypothetical protein [Tissierella carlieri]|nr:hypothetical protein [Tissierella carlieri]
MSNTSNLHDNAIIEPFNKSLETEMMDDNKVLTIREEGKRLYLNI